MATRKRTKQTTPRIGAPRVPSIVGRRVEQAGESAVVALDGNCRVAVIKHMVKLMARAQGQLPRPGNDRALPRASS